MLREWVKRALQSSSLKQVELARLLTEAVGRSVDPTAVTKMIGGDRRIFADEMIAISRICKYPLPPTLAEAVAGSPSVHTVNVLDGLSFIIVASDELHKQISYSLLRSGKIIQSNDINMLANEITDALIQAGKTSGNRETKMGQTAEKIQAVIDAHRAQPAESVPFES